MEQEHKELCHTLKLLWDEAYRIFMEAESFKAFYSALDDYNTQMAKITAAGYRPLAVTSWFIVFNAYLVIRKTHSESPFYTFRKAFMEQLERDIHRIKDASTQVVQEHGHASN